MTRPGSPTTILTRDLLLDGAEAGARTKELNAASVAYTKAMDREVLALYEAGAIDKDTPQSVINALARKRVPSEVADRVTDLQSEYDGALAKALLAQAAAFNAARERDEKYAKGIDSAERGRFPGGGP